MACSQKKVCAANYACLSTGTHTDFQGKSLSSVGAALSKKLSAPSLSERRQLANLFPTSRAGCSSKRAFDPTAECVALPRQKKKKAANATGRATNREVVLMKEFRKVIPIKKFRSDLRSECRIQTLQFKRSMSPLQVNNVIQRGFHQILGASSFQFLEVTSNSLTVAPNQAYDGAAVIDRRGALYLCETKVSHAV